MATLIQQIHASVAVDDSPKAIIGGKEVSVFPPRFEVFVDEIPQSTKQSVVLALLYADTDVKMLRAFWIYDSNFAENFIRFLPGPDQIITKDEAPKCKATLMPERDWRFYREEWLSMNRSEDLDPCD